MKLIVAVDENGGIGNKGKIPWRCVEDQLFFRFLTMGECVFMGRETYNSLPKSLSGRRNFVITSSDEPLRTGFRRGDLKMMYDINDGFIIGGQMLYNDAIVKGYADTLYLSRITGLHECDRFFTVPKSLKKVASLELSSDCTVEKWTHDNDY